MKNLMKLSTSFAFSAGRELLSLRQASFFSESPASRSFARAELLKLHAYIPRAIMSGSSARGETALEYGGRGGRHGRGRGGADDAGPSGRAGSRGRGRGGGGSSGRPEDVIDALGRCMTKILRHNALDYGLPIRPDGYVPVDSLLRLNVETRARRRLISHTIEDVRQAVAQDNKQRFGLKEEDGIMLIRANQGHSIQVVESEQLLRPITSAEEIPTCVHGTYLHGIKSILEQGLSRMNRVHIHFATGLPRDDGVVSGMRSSCQVLIFLDVERALADGIRLYMSENGVVLSEGVNGLIAPKYFAKVVKWPSLQPVDG